eukprot:4795521-Amphidinium_carterae.1
MRDIQVTLAQYCSHWNECSTPIKYSSAVVGTAKQENASIGTKEDVLVIDWMMCSPSTGHEARTASACLHNARIRAAL